MALKLSRIFWIIAFLPTYAFGQLSNFDNPQKQNLRILSIGISEYSVESLNLRFAAKDAMEFNQLWISDDVKQKYDVLYNTVITNQRATSKKIQAELNVLRASTKAGDKLIIYFSGHGGIDISSYDGKVYLLTNETPSDPYNYMGNSLSLNLLNEYINEVSHNKADIIIIIDACHSGKAFVKRQDELLNNEIKKSTGNEVRILSCSAKEKSYEDEIIGGGRGVFSFYLTEGLKGAADKNLNRIVELNEINTYITKELNIYSKKHIERIQNPIIITNNPQNKQYQICPVDKDFLLSSQFTENIIETNNYAAKTVEPLLYYFKGQDSLNFIRFVNLSKNTGVDMLNLKTGAIVEYNKLMNLELPNYIKAYITDLFIAALQYKGSIILNYTLQNDRMMSTEDELNGIIKEFEFSKSLEKLNKIDTNETQSKIYYFNSMKLKFNKKDFYSNKELQQIAIDYAKKAIQLDKEKVYYQYNLAWLYQITKQYDLAILRYKDCINLRPFHDKAYNNIAICYEFIDKNHTKEAYQNYKKAIEINPDYNDAILNFNKFKKQHPEFAN